MTMPEGLVSMHVWAAIVLLEDGIRASRGETWARRMARHAAEDAQYGMPEAP